MQLHPVNDAILLPDRRWFYCFVEKHRLTDFFFLTCCAAVLPARVKPAACSPCKDETCKINSGVVDPFDIARAGQPTDLEAWVCRFCDVCSSNDIFAALLLLTHGSPSSTPAASPLYRCFSSAFSPISTASVPFLYKTATSLCTPDAAFGDVEYLGRNQRPQTHTVFDIHSKILQVPIVDADDPHSGTQRPRNLFFVVCLN